MRRAMLVALTASALMVVAGCGANKDATPSVGTQRFTARVQLIVADATTPRFTAERVPVGSVLDVVNRGRHDTRVQGTMSSVPVFDTGRLGPGQHTVVVLGTAGELGATVVATGAHTALDVTPKPKPKS